MKAGSEDSISGLPPLRDVIKAHGLRAEKKLGQNFLLDLNITDKIARACGDVSDMNVIEIGPGPGGLTRSLLNAGAKSVTAVEFDERAVQALQDLERAAQGRLTIMHADALKTDLREISAPPRLIAANLPYNIATPLLTGWLAQIREDASVFAQMTLMFQKEVADRITAAPGSKTYGRLSVLSQWLCDCRKVMDLPPSAFTPPPKVSSSIVRFTPHLSPAHSANASDEAKPHCPPPLAGEGWMGENPSFQAVERVTAAAFGQRRKMARSSLKDYADYFEAAGVNPESRAEDLTPAQFVALALLDQAGKKRKA